MITAVFPLALAAYTAGVVLAILGMIRRSRHAGSAATASYCLAFALHLCGIVLHIVETGSLAMTNMSEFLLGFGWLILALYIIVHFRWRMPAVDLLLPPVAFIVTLVALALPATEAESPQLTSPGVLLFHTTLSTMGMAAFFVAAAMSLSYVIQDHALKNKKALRWLNRLPSLSRADRAGLEAVLWGFPLFTLGILAGIGLNATKHHTLWQGGPKEIFPVVAWVIFAGVILARLAWGFRGRKAAYLTMAGFLLSLLTILGISL